MKITGLELKPCAVREWNAPLFGEEPLKITASQYWLAIADGIRTRIIASNEDIFNLN